MQALGSQQSFGRRIRAGIGTGQFIVRPDDPPVLQGATPFGGDGPLVALARLAMASPDTASIELLARACALVRDTLGAQESYLIRAGDPYFIRVDAPDDPTAYEIKQKGYFLIWRELATRPQLSGGLFRVADRRAQDPAPLGAGITATHYASILPGHESNSEMLIVRGPWLDGLSADQVAFLTAARPMLSHLLGNALDAERQARQRTQLGLLAEVASAFTAARDMTSVLSAIATALAKASGFDWVTVTLFDTGLKRIDDLAQNVARHSGTSIAAEWRRISELAAPRWISLAKSLEQSKQPLLVPDISKVGVWSALNNPLMRYYERAHILSYAGFPICFQEQLLGLVYFSSCTRRAFGGEEVELLTALVAQAAASIGGLRLHADLRRATDQLTHLATHDALTGLPNRSIFAERLREMIAAALESDRQGALLYLDLDNFKVVNDTLGHGAGDALLQEVAARLQRCLPPAATAARLGGDEFAAILPEMSPEGAATIAGDILTALAEPVEAGGATRAVSASIGISCFPADGTEADVLVRNADMAMYAAKAAGRNAYQCFHASLVAAYTPAPS